LGENILISKTVVNQLEVDTQR